jgi:hypothetical protein
MDAIGLRTEGHSEFLKLVSNGSGGHLIEFVSLPDGNMPCLPDPQRELTRPAFPGRAIGNLPWALYSRYGIMLAELLHIDGANARAQFNGRNRYA